MVVFLIKTEDWKPVGYMGKQAKRQVLEKDLHYWGI